MKKLWILLALASLLCGCAAEETLETVSDDIIQPVMAQPGEISVRLPDNAVAPVLESDSEQVYLSEDYEIIVETVSGGGPERHHSADIRLHPGQSDGDGNGAGRGKAV